MSVNDYILCIINDRKKELKIDGGKGCLVILSVNKNTNNENDVEIDFIKQNNRWLFDYFGVRIYNVGKRQDKDKAYFCDELRQEKVKIRNLNAKAEK